MSTDMTDGLTFDFHGESRASRPTVFLSSGLGGAAAYWRHQVPALVAAGLNVITYDQRGTGRSSGALPKEYSISHMADDVLLILDKTNISDCHFVGHALGGLVGLELAIKAPTRLASLSLINAWPKICKHTERCFKARLSLLASCGTAAYVQAQPLFLYPAAWSEEHYQEIETEVEHAISHFPGASIMNSRIDALKMFDASEGLKGIAMPVWLSAATDDILVPWTASQELAKRLPSATFELVPTGGHAHNQTEPEEFNKSLLTFLARAIQQRHVKE